MSGRVITYRDVFPNLAQQVEKQLVRDLKPAIEETWKERFSLPIAFSMVESHRWTADHITWLQVQRMPDLTHNMHVLSEILQYPTRPRPTPASRGKPSSDRKHAFTGWSHTHFAPDPLLTRPPYFRMHMANLVLRLMQPDDMLQQVVDWNNDDHIEPNRLLRALRRDARFDILIHSLGPALLEIAAPLVDQLGIDPTPVYKTAFVQADNPWDSPDDLVLARAILRRAVDRQANGLARKTTNANIASDAERSRMPEVVAARQTRQAQQEAARRTNEAKRPEIQKRDAAIAAKYASMLSACRNKVTIARERTAEALGVSEPTVRAALKRHSKRTAST